MSISTQAQIKLDLEQYADQLASDPTHSISNHKDTTMFEEPQKEEQQCSNSIPKQMEIDPNLVVAYTTVDGGFWYPIHLPNRYVISLVFSWNILESDLLTLLNIESIAAARTADGTVYSFISRRIRSTNKQEQTTQSYTQVSKADSALNHQIGGNHYKKYGDYQPWQVLAKWLSPEELKGAMKKEVITYIARCDDKGGRQDIEKAMHTIQIYLELTK